MNKLSVMLVYTLIATAGAAQTSVASYPFNGNANDASGNNNNGVVTGAVLTTDRFGSVNKAYSFNGTTDKIEAPNNPTLALLANYTISAWVKAVATPAATGSLSGFTIASKDEGPGTNTPKWIFLLQNGGLAFHINGPGLNSGVWLYSNTFTLTLNQWYHCAMVKTGNNVSFFVNGSSFGTFTLSSPSVNPAATLSIGYSEPSLSFNGAIDEVTIYNYPLTPQQIADNYASSAIILSLPFNGNANDATGNGNNGTVNGATLTTDRFGNAASAYSFDGINNWIQGNADNLPVGDLTVSLWFYADAGTIASRPGVFGYGGNGSGACPGASIIMGINTLSTGAAGKYMVQSHCETSMLLSPSYATAPEQNWYQWTFTRSGNTSSLYINGVLHSTGPYTTNIQVAGRNYSIGAIVSPAGTPNYADASTSRFKGKIDDVKIYNVPLPATQIFDEYVNDLKKPGSGNSILFDNSLIQAVNVGTGFDQTGSFSFETWVKRTSTTITDFNSQTFMASQLNGGWSIGINQSFPVNKIYLSKVGISQVVSASSISDTKWHHVAVTYNATTNTVLFYIDGKADSPVPYSPGTFNSGNTTYRIGGRNNGINFDNNLNGALDEVRVWNGIVLTEAEIRDWMCKKINSSHSRYNSLQGYFRFDEGASTITRGYNARFGSFENGPVWQTSGAALGDAAVHDFVSSTKTATIPHATGESFLVTSTSGAPDGILVYRVDEQPNSIIGANNGNNNKYFGVFQSGGTLPQYTAVYNYTGNPFVNAGNENDLRLAKRADNSVSIWNQLTALPNTAVNTISIAGESTEYILGQVGNPLPLSLLGFTGSKCNTAVCLLWSTENEQNLSRFELEKSSDGLNFNRIITIAAQNNLHRNSYMRDDAMPVSGANYYRLKIVNADGSFTYSRILKIDFSQQAIVSIQPNPANHAVFIKGLEGYRLLRVLDMSGKIRWQQNIRQSIEEINISNFPAGLYLVQVQNENETVSFKFLKQ